MKEDSKKDYELAFLLLDAESAPKLFDFLKNQGSEPYYKSSVNQIRLAYPIKKQNIAYFGFCNFRSEAQNAPKLKKDLELMPYILRMLLVTPPVKALAEEERRSTIKPPEVRPEQPIKVLTNEALEQKLEEILK